MGCRSIISKKRYIIPKCLKKLVKSLSGYAQEHIYYTLMELMKTIPLDHIKVNDIVERGHINRKTFYYHFHSIEDLLKWVVTMKMQHLTLKNADAENWKEKTGQLVLHIESNKDFYCALFASKYGAGISSYLCIKFRPYIAEFIGNCKKESEARRGRPFVLEDKFYNYIVDYYLKGIMSLVEEWIRGGCSEAPEDFLNIMDNLTKNTIFNVLDAFCPPS